MKTLRLNLLLIFALAATTTVAQERFGGQTQEQSVAQAQEVDTQRFCVYAGKTYSIGALIQVGDNVLECRMQPSTSDLVEAGARWASVYSDTGAT